jgi:hypothetical protein
MNSYINYSALGLFDKQTGHKSLAQFGVELNLFDKCLVEIFEKTSFCEVEVNSRGVSSQIFGGLNRGEWAV